MKQNFELDLEKSQLFIKYFNAAMRDPKCGFLQANGSSHFKSGKYITEQSVNFKFKGKKIFVIWEIIFKNNILESIENINSVDDDGSYDLLLSDFIITILQRVLTEKKEKYFKRVMYKAISGCNLPGEYWLPGFRFAPLYPDDESRIMNSERIVVFDQLVEAIDNRHADEVALENAAKYSAYMSFILDLGLYKPIHEKLYFLNKDGSEHEMERKSTQLVVTNTPNKMPKKKEICKLADFKNDIFQQIRFMNEYLVCPIQTRKILRAISDADENIQDAFLSCSLLYQLALNAGKYYPTVRLSYICGAVESIVKSNQKKYKSFSSFMGKYAGENKKLYDLIYRDVRSAHWHSGKFALGEFNFESDFIMNPGRHLTFNIIRVAHEKMRLAILNWLYDALGLEKENNKLLS